MRVCGLKPDRFVGYVESKTDISWKKTGYEKQDLGTGWQFLLQADGGAIEQTENMVEGVVLEGVCCCLVPQHVKFEVCRDIQMAC